MLIISFVSWWFIIEKYITFKRVEKDIYEFNQLFWGKNSLDSIFSKVLNKFDLVIASEVIEHVYDRRKFLSDISNLCRPGGLVIFTTINNSILGILLGKYFAEDILKIFKNYQKS